MSRDEVISTTKECTEKLGHVPSVEELLGATQINKHLIRKRFGTYRALLEACGLERHGSGYEVKLESLFLDWAGVVRMLGKVPSMTEYALNGEYSNMPLIKRFGGWRHVPLGMRRYAREQGVEEEWKDVVEIVARHLEPTGKRARNSVLASAASLKPRVRPDVPIFGLPMMAASPMVYAPTNEAGVMVLFGAVAREQGFAITRVQQAFPDCEAMREIEPERCQPSRIEFEFESRNFLVHLHPVDGADVIVCWKHNWPECPLEVLELSTMTWHRPVR
ncbi:MAG TPA: hypothetical protein VGK36_08100 [Candidatus Angelobacter sp.]